MEQLKKLASRGVELDDEALEQLDLLELGSIHYPDLEDITQLTEAQTVNRVLTVDFAKNLTELLYYLSRAIFNSMVHYTITVDKVLREMLTQVTSIRDFCLKVGVEKETKVHVKALNWHIPQTRNAIGGDLMSTHDLGLTKLPFLKIISIKQTPSMETPFRSFGSAAKLTTTGWYSGDESVKKVNCCTGAMCELIQQQLHPQSKPLRVWIYGSDVCESVVALIQEIEQSVAIIDEKTMKQVMEEYSDRELKFLAEEKDPSYSPEAEEQEEEDEDEDVVVPSPEAAPTASKKKSQKFTGREKNVVAQSLSGCQKDIVPPPTEKAQSVSTSKRKPTLAGEDEPKEKGRKRSHHTKRMCPVCKKEDANSKRHLLTHARKGHKGGVGSFNPEHRSQQRKKARACMLKISRQARAERLEAEMVPCKGLPKSHASTKKLPFHIPQY